ncbi:MAG: succinylglutamate desuccinylase/aspartoacylase family protein [Verrucomicrobiales bacterium]|nr:succinylglutamate desuccinylase/aspartoacylase family protein [Verrucomicrobiales bacterium]
MSSTDKKNISPAQPRREIKIGGVEFKPGKKGVVDLPIGSLIDYQPVTMTVHVRRGRKDGPCLLVTAGLHGDEINGVEIIRRLLKSRLLSSLSGDLIAIPVVNMPAFLARSRYLPDRRDLNRLFPGSAKGSLGGRLAYAFCSEVMPLCTHAIDMHTGAVGRPNLPQIRVSPGDEIGFEMAKAFKPPVVIEAGLRDQSLRASYYRNAKPSILYEAGEARRLDSSAVRYGFRGIISVMRFLEMLPTEKKPSIQKSKTVFSPSTSWIRASSGGIFTPLARLGKAVPSGGILGIVADPFGRHETKIKSAADGVVIGISREATVDEGDALFHVAASADAERAEAHIEKSGAVLEASPETEHVDFPDEI